MTRSEFEVLLNRYLLGQGTDNENEKIRIWFENIKTEKDAGISDEQKTQLERSLLSEINDQIEKNKKSKAKPFNETLYDFLKHGSFAALIMFPIFLLFGDRFSIAYHLWVKNSVENSKYKTITQINKHHMYQVIFLEDSTEVSLTKGSSISYKEPFEEDKREVTLQGAGFFKVRKNSTRPFYVSCSGIVTEVIGTSFWVTSESKSKSVEIGVRTGQVSVTVNPNTADKKEPDRHTKKMMITPNQRIVFFSESQKIEKMLVAKPMVMETETIAQLKFVYKDAPLVTVLKELGQSYNVEILMLNERLRLCSFTGDLSDMSFQEKFDLVSASVGGRYDIQGTSIVLAGPGCKNNL